MSGTAWIVAAVVGIALATLSYWVARRQDLMAIVDLNWTLGVGLAAVVLFIVEGPQTLRAGLVLGVALLWSGRISWHLFRDRVLPGKEDGRYEALKKHWGEAAPRNFYFLFLAQVGLVFLFGLPIYAAIANPEPLAWTDGLAILIALTAIAGEATADRQLARFRSRSDSSGKVCRIGLWRYSRHPNYFFEWLYWCAYVAFTWGSERMLLAIVGPLLMYLFLRFITGVPYVERRSLESRGDAYREYQNTTNAFWPWIPRKHPND